MNPYSIFLSAVFHSLAGSFSPENELGMDVGEYLKTLEHLLSARHCAWALCVSCKSVLAIYLSDVQSLPSLQMNQTKDLFKSFNPK